jgi:hypothetical protein
MSHNPTNKAARLVTLQAASDEWGVPYTSLRDLVIQGLLPRVRLGHSRRIWVSRDALEAFLKRNEEAG